MTSLCNMKVTSLLVLILITGTSARWSVSSNTAATASGGNRAYSTQSDNGNGGNGGYSTQSDNGNSVHTGGQQGYSQGGNGAQKVSMNAGYGQMIEMMKNMMQGSQDKPAMGYNAMMQMMMSRMATNKNSQQAWPRTDNSQNANSHSQVWYNQANTDTQPQDETPPMMSYRPAVQSAPEKPAMMSYRPAAQNAQQNPHTMQNPAMMSYRPVENTQQNPKPMQNQATMSYHSHGASMTMQDTNQQSSHSGYGNSGMSQQQEDNANSEDQQHMVYGNSGMNREPADNGNSGMDAHPTGHGSSMGMEDSTDDEMAGDDEGDNYVCKHGTLQEDPVYYDAFQTCVFGRYVTMQCAPGTHYCGNPICGTCKLDENGMPEVDSEEDSMTNNEGEVKGYGEDNNEDMSSQHPRGYGASNDQNDQTDSMMTDWKQDTQTQSNGNSQSAYGDIDPAVMIMAMGKAIKSGRFTAEQTEKMKQMLVQMMTVMMIMKYAPENSNMMGENMDTSEMMEMMESQMKGMTKNSYHQMRSDRGQSQTSGRMTSYWPVQQQMGGMMQNNGNNNQNKMSYAAMNQNQHHMSEMGDMRSYQNTKPQQNNDKSQGYGGMNQQQMQEMMKGYGGMNQQQMQSMMKGYGGETRPQMMTNSQTGYGTNTQQEEANKPMTGGNGMNGGYGVILSGGDFNDNNVSVQSTDAENDGSKHGVIIRISLGSQDDNDSDQSNAKTSSGYSK